MTKRVVLGSDEDDSDGEEEESCEEEIVDRSHEEESSACKIGKSKLSMNGLKIDVKIDIPAYDGTIIAEKLHN